MKAHIDLKTSVKLNDKRTQNSTLTKFIVGNSIQNSWSWNTPALSESVNSSLTGTIYIFADGLSESVVNGDCASVALKTIQDHFEKIVSFSALTLDINQEIKVAFLEAHHAIVEHTKANPQQQEEAGTNIFIAWIVEDQLYAGWNSECNFYGFENGILEQLDDESMEICSHLDFKNTTHLTNHQYIGSAKNPPRIKTLKNGFIDLNEVERLLFCSYGFHKTVGHRTIESTLRDVEMHEMTTSALIKAANSAGSFTNNSIWLIDFEKKKLEEDEGKSRFKKRYALPFLALLMAAGIGFIGGSQFSSLGLQEQTAGIKSASVPVSYSSENIIDNEITAHEKPQTVVKKQVPKKKVTKKKNISTSKKTESKTIKAKKRVLTGRMKVLEDKVINWNNDKFLLLKKMNTLEAFLKPTSSEALKELTVLKERRTQLNSGLVEIIELDENRKPVYDENNQIYLSADVTQETVEQKFWRLHHQLETLEKDLKELCRRYYCKDLIK